jgi:hypothetical protein
MYGFAATAGLIRMAPTRDKKSPNALPTGTETDFTDN